ncbi:MtrAB system accessory lipoprotein LpqB [Microbacterium awajiense]|uniref:MtrAB system accessory lipoprotein LpqB n=1 Tax=Microbacterium awajiense TaxID=415214 RepID=A0ABP7ADQ0_9MICO
MTRRMLAAAIAATLALLLAACASLPTSGPVNRGLVPEEESEAPFAFVPARPQPGATPEEIVDGFLRAGTGVTDNWLRAREYLAPSIREQWRPSAGVTVDVSVDRVIGSNDEGRVSVRLVTVASVDAQGAYEPSDQSTATLDFELAQQADGEWRITAAPDGIVLGRDVFPRVFHRYSVMFFDPTWTYLVPDTRWYPTAYAVVRIAAAVVDGVPTPWLSESVVSAFPESVQLEPASVPLSGGVAQVGLSTNALALDTTTHSRMQAQLDASLATAGVASVEMSVGSAPIDVTAAPTRSTRVSGPPLVLTEAGFGFLSGEELTEIPGLSDAVVAQSPTAVQVAPERDLAAVRRPDGAAVRVEASGAWILADARAGLASPSIDPHGYVWSAIVDDPASLQAVGDDGEAIAIADAWPGAARITAFSVSRDGARIAAAVSVGGEHEVWVAGVVRDGQVPVRLGEGDPLMLGSLAGEALSLTWLDDTTIGVVARTGDDRVVVEQPTGGSATSYIGPPDAVSLAAANPLSNLRVRSADDAMFVRRGTNWTESATGVLVLATQQGAPQ